MAKKIQRKLKAKAKAKPKSRRATSHPFMAAQQNDLADLITAAGKGPQKDQAGSRFIAPSVNIDTRKPDSRED